MDVTEGNGIKVTFDKNQKKLIRHVGSGTMIRVPKNKYSFHAITEAKAISCLQNIEWL